MGSNFGADRFMRREEGRNLSADSGKRDTGTLIVDPTGGLSGDMFLGCLFALGVKAKDVEREVARLPRFEPFRIVVGRVKRRGISAFRARVRCTAGARSRDLGGILRMIERSPLDGRVKELSARTFQLLGEAEGKIHGTPVENVHFHEVGAVDSIVDIVGSVVALSMLRFPRLYHRPFRLGSGTISISHGELPVPAPATLELLKGRTIQLCRDEVELVTPTGAALMRALAEELPPDLSFTPARIVYSVGTREPEAGPGILRMIEAEVSVPKRAIMVIRTTIDDMNPETYGFIQERLFEEGALEVYLTQVIMKKGRPGVLVTVLCDSVSEDRIVNLLFHETTTLGVRISREGREELERWMGTVRTPLGDVEVKCGRLPDGGIKIAPEFESCRRVARSNGIPVNKVFELVYSLTAMEGVSRSAGEERGASRGSPGGKNEGRT